MISEKFNLLLADDDNDDCLLFQDALNELQLSASLTVVNDGEQLMGFLKKNVTSLPDMLFLDLNMPRKNGHACLEEIKNDPKLKSLTVIVLSTSFDESIADILYQKGALYYICKPTYFPDLKKIIHKVLELVSRKHNFQPPRTEFLLSSTRS